jgi:hypothetical protein
MLVYSAGTQQSDPGYEETGLKVRIASAIWVAKDLHEGNVD